MRYSMRHFRQTHASYQCAKRKQKRTSVDIRCVRFAARVDSSAVGVSERMEHTGNVKVKAALVSLGQYVKQNFFVLL